MRAALAIVIVVLSACWASIVALAQSETATLPRTISNSPTPAPTAAIVLSDGSSTEWRGIAVGTFTCNEPGVPIDLVADFEDGPSVEIVGVSLVVAVLSDALAGVRLATATCTNLHSHVVSSAESLANVDSRPAPARPQTEDSLVGTSGVAKTSAASGPWATPGPVFAAPGSSSTEASKPMGDLRHETSCVNLHCASPAELPGPAAMALAPLPQAHVPLGRNPAIVVR
jgi:hypothetical protein